MTLKQQNKAKQKISLVAHTSLHQRACSHQCDGYVAHHCCLGDDTQIHDREGDEESKQEGEDINADWQMRICRQIHIPEPLQDRVFFF